MPLAELTQKVDTLEARLVHVEQTIMNTILPEMQQASLDRTALKNDTAEILEFVSGAKKAGSYVAQYGPKLLTFGAGIMTAIGVGNPALWEFITKFFAH